MSVPLLLPTAAHRARLLVLGAGDDAVRVQRAARALGVGAVQLYLREAPDARALRGADATVALEGPRPDAVASVARACEATAVVVVEPAAGLAEALRARGLDVLELRAAAPVEHRAYRCAVVVVAVDAFGQALVLGTRDASLAAAGLGFGEAPAPFAGPLESQSVLAVSNHAPGLWAVVFTQATDGARFELEGVHAEALDALAPIELCAGADLVRTWLALRLGARLGPPEPARGHAVEARLTMSASAAAGLRLAPGHGVRWSTRAGHDERTTVHLCCHDDRREDALNGLLAVLRELGVPGAGTLRAALLAPEVQRGTQHAGLFVERAEDEDDDAALVRLVAAAALVRHRNLGGERTFGRGRRAHGEHA